MERRNHQRYVVQSGTFAVLRSTSIELGKIKDMSMGEIAFAVIKSKPIKMGQIINISTDGLKIILRIEKDGDKSPMIKNIKIDIYPPKSFPDRYRNAILKAAALCTVKKQLEHPPTIDITLKK